MDWRLSCPAFRCSDQRRLSRRWIYAGGDQRIYHENKGQNQRTEPTLMLKGRNREPSRLKGGDNEQPRKALHHKSFGTPDSIYLCVGKQRKTRKPVGP